MNQENLTDTESEDFLAAMAQGEKEMIERLEAQKKERDSRKEKLETLLFEQWLETITDEEKKTLAVPMGDFMGAFHLQELKEYFRKEVYSSKKALQ